MSGYSEARLPDGGERLEAYLNSKDPHEPVEPFESTADNVQAAFGVEYISGLDEPTEAGTNEAQEEA